MTIETMKLFDIPDACSFCEETEGLVLLSTITRLYIEKDWLGHQNEKMLVCQKCIATENYK